MKPTIIPCMHLTVNDAYMTQIKKILNETIQAGNHKLVMTLPTVNNQFFHTQIEEGITEFMLMYENKNEIVCLLYRHLQHVDPYDYAMGYIITKEYAQLLKHAAEINTSVNQILAPYLNNICEYVSDNTNKPRTTEELKQMVVYNNLVSEHILLQLYKEIDTFESVQETIQTNHKPTH